MWPASPGGFGGSSTCAGSLPRPALSALGAAAGLTAVAACLVVWLANPYFALLLVPLVHVVAILGARGSPAGGVLRSRRLALAALPLLAALVYVASALDWGAS